MDIDKLSYIEALDSMTENNQRLIVNKYPGHGLPWDTVMLNKLNF